MLENFETEMPGRKNGSRSKWDRVRFSDGRNWKNSDFQCKYCQNYVSAAVKLAGVQNRNHCPYCLWSKHLDLYQSGDRMAICKAGMRPVALTLKQSQKKYTYPFQGELMIVHQCEGCEKISINRIAADDDPDRIVAVLDASTGLEETFHQRLAGQGIFALDNSKRGIVVTRLLGGFEPSRTGNLNPA